MADTRLARVHEHLEKLKKNSIRILSTECDENQIPVGRSKRGGRPDLPDNLTWPVVCFADPMWTQLPRLSLEEMRNELDDDLNALAFVAQVRLSEIHPLDVENELPTTGMLYFFELPPWGSADLDDIREMRVIFSESESDLVRTNFPEELEEDLRYESMSLTFSCEWQLPSVQSHFVDTDKNLVLGCEFTDTEMNLYASEQNRLSIAGNQLLGYAVFFQMTTLKRSYRDSFLPFIRFSQLEADYPIAPNWDTNPVNLLFQIDLGVHQRFYFIHQSDLATNRFERAWVGIE
jgi:uncharacterized protein YwqG